MGTTGGDDAPTHGGERRQGGGLKGGQGKGEVMAQGGAPARVSAPTS